MKRALVPMGFALGALFALPARGDETELSEGVTDALTTIDALPTTGSLDLVFDDGALGHLVEIASDSTFDNLGLQLRAIRALPSYCPHALDFTSHQPCDQGEPHDTLSALVIEFSVPASDPDGTAYQTLRLRAAVEALGATHSANDADVQLILPLLDNPSRDIRVAAAYALRSIPVIDDQPACAALDRHHLAPEPSLQVRAACEAAIHALPPCQ